MSGLLDKKPGGATRRLERELKEQREKRRIRVIAITVVAVLAVLFAAALFLNSKFARRNLTAVSIGGVNFTPVEFDYFFRSARQEYENMVNQQMGDYASSMLPTNDRPLSSQIYDPDTSRTWADFFVEYAIEQMSELVKYHNAAVAAGFTLSDEDRATMESELAEFKQMIELYSYIYPSFEYYLQMAYGSNIDEDSFRKINEFIYTANMFSDHVRDASTYSPSELENHYIENKDMLDVYTYRYFLMYAETVLESDYPDEADYEAAKEEAMDVVRGNAAAMIAAVESEDDFIAAAFEYDETAHSEADSTLRVYPGSWLGSYYGPWVRDEERVYGDKTYEETTNGVYVVFFVSRDDNNYRMAEMRQLLILRDEIDPYDFLDGIDDPEYLEAVELADAEARERANEVWDLFIERGASEEALLGLMEEYSDDTTEGGYYDNISRDPSQSKMVDEIETWLFEDGRQVGEYALIRTEAYGYHLVFYTGFGEVYRDFISDKEMREDDYNAWRESLAEVESVRRWAFMLIES